MHPLSTLLLGASFAATLSDPTLDDGVSDPRIAHCQGSADVNVAYAIRDGQLRLSAGDHRASACLEALGPMPVKLPDGEGQVLLLAASKEALEARRQEKMKEEVLQNSQLLTAMIGTRGEAPEDAVAEDALSGADVDAALQQVSGAESDIGTLSETKTARPTAPAVKISGNIQVGLREDSNPDITKTIRKYQGQVKYCYESRLKVDPTISGDLALQFSVAGGRVVDQTITENTTGDEMLGKCALNKVRTWRFPETVEGPVNASWTLTPSE